MKRSLWFLNPKMCQQLPSISLHRQVAVPRAVGIVDVLQHHVRFLLTKCSKRAHSGTNLIDLHHQINHRPPEILVPVKHLYHSIDVVVFLVQVLMSSPHDLPAIACCISFNCGSQTPISTFSPPQRVPRHQHYISSTSILPCHATERFSRLRLQIVVLFVVVPCCVSVRCCHILRKCSNLCPLPRRASTVVIPTSLDPNCGGSSVVSLLMRDYPLWSSS